MTCVKCKNPRHKEHVKNFVRKYPIAKGRVPDTIITVDSKYWYISDNPQDNTIPCCQVCSISEDIIRANSPDRKKEPDRTT
ncbi:MAG: hypothetical protein ACRD5B_18625 [Nitrososphaeraceae archaeon]